MEESVMSSVVKVGDTSFRLIQKGTGGSGNRWIQHFVKGQGWLDHKIAGNAEDLFLKDGFLAYKTTDGKIFADGRGYMGSGWGEVEQKDEPKHKSCEIKESKTKDKKETVEKVDDSELNRETEKESDTNRNFLKNPPRYKGGFWALLTNLYIWMFWIISWECYALYWIIAKPVKLIILKVLSKEDTADGPSIPDFLKTPPLPKKAGFWTFIATLYILPFWFIAWEFYGFYWITMKLVRTFS